MLATAALTISAGSDPAAARPASRSTPAASAARTTAAGKTTAKKTPEMRGTAVAAARASAAGIRWGACTARYHLAGLDPPVQCGTVTVPLDYAHPGGKQITLTVTRRPATDSAAHRTTSRGAARQGALVFSPGDPGATGVYVPLIPDLSSYWKPLAAAYDLVGYAPRGIGRPAPLSCQDPARSVATPTQAPRRPSAAYQRQRRAQAKAYAEGCARRGGAALRHYTTADNARDLDVLRAALGERRLTFMGASYGAYVGAVYATFFPSHVRRMVFDSPPDPAPGALGYRTVLAQSRALQRRWTDFGAWVAAHDGTYHLGGTAAQVERAYEKVRAALARRPAGGTVGPGQLQAAFLKAAYYDDYWPVRAAALAAYLGGDPQPLTRQAEPVGAAAVELENDQAVDTAVACNDAPWPTDWRTWARDATRLARVAPFATWANVRTHLPCAYWRTPRQPPVNVRSRAGALPPTLVLAAERDGVTPYAGARELHGRLAGSVLVTERGAGLHIIGGGPDDCVNAHLRRYLLTGRPPARDADCAPHPAPKPLSRSAPSHPARPARDGPVPRRPERPNRPASVRRAPPRARPPACGAR